MIVYMNPVRSSAAFISFGMLLCFSAFITKADAQQLSPVKVEIRKTDAGYRLFRGGQPYFIKGAGGTRYSDRLAQYGGNSMRTWGTGNGEEVLNNAEKLG